MFEKENEILSAIATLCQVIQVSKLIPSTDLKLSEEASAKIRELIKKIK